MKNSELWILAVLLWFVFLGCEKESGDNNKEDFDSGVNAHADMDEDGADVDADIDTDADGDTDTDTDADADADGDTDMDADADTDSGTETATDSETSTGTDSDTGSAPHPFQAVFYTSIGMNGGGPDPRAYFVNLTEETPGVPAELDFLPHLTAAVWKTAPGSAYLLIEGRSLSDSKVGVYLVDLSSGTPAASVRLTDTETSEGYRRIAIPAAADQVVLTGRGSGDDWDLLRVRIEKGQPAAPEDIAPLLSPFVVALSDDGSRAVFVGRPKDAPDDPYSFYAIELGQQTASPPEKIDVSFDSLAQLGQLGLSADGSTLVYVLNWPAQGAPGIFAVYLDGDKPSAPARITLEYQLGGEVENFKFTADGKRLLYVADEGVVSDPTQQPVTMELFYVPDVKAAPLASQIRVHDVLPDYWKVNKNYLPAVGDTKVVYMVNTPGDLWVTGITGVMPGTPQMIQSKIDIFFLSENEKCVFFTTGQGSDQGPDLYFSDLDGAQPTAPTRINPSQPSPRFRRLSGYHNATTTGDGVVYMADETTEGVYELFYVDLGASKPGPPITVSGPAVQGRMIDTWSLLKDNRTLVYLADQDQKGVTELYRVLLEGGNPSTPVKINHALAAQEEIYRLKVLR